MSCRTRFPRGEAMVVLVTLLCSSARPACASDTSLSIGVRTWASTWSTWGLAQTTYNGASYQTVASLESGTEVAVTPIISVRSGDWFGSASYMTKTKYSLTSAEPAGPLQHAIGVRSEFDVNVGYYVVSGLGVTAGYKELWQQFGTTYRWSGPTLGLTMSAPLGTSGLGVYGTIGYGFLTLDLPSGTTDANGHSSRPANYELGEVGLAYVFSHLSVSRFHVTLTLGYRSQTVTTNNYGLSSSPLNNPAALSAYTQTDLRDHTEGFTLTLLATL